MKRASMNHTFRLVWSDVQQAWIPVPEIGRAKGKSARGAASIVLASLLLAGAPFAWADGVLPTGGKITAGAGSIAQSGPSMTIHQTSGSLSLDWNSFSIGQGNTVTFVQPGVNSIALNQVTGSDVSTIQGALKANGQVFLSNPNGILFSPTARVDVGGLIATTRAITEKDGIYVLEGDGSASVVNQGFINAANGGTVALVAARVVNQGGITASQGSVLLGAGNKVTLDLGGPVKIRVDAGALDALIEQGGAIRADGGRVYMTAASANALKTTVINHTGVTEARTLATGETGEIVLLGGMAQDRIAVAGTLDASAPRGGNGGFIETSAAQVHIDDALRVTTLASGGASGNWLIDPHNLTIADTSSSGMSGFSAGADDSVLSVTSLTNALATTGVTVSTGSGGSQAGTITVAAPITWSANTTLTLDAASSVVINQNINATGTSAGLVLTNANYRLGNGARVTLPGSNASLSIGGTAYTLIHDATQLQAMSGNLAGHYALGNDIDASVTAGWNAGLGFAPVGNGSSTFTGKLDGLGSTIKGLTINRQGSTDLYVGLFGVVGTSGVVRDVGLVGGSITGAGNTNQTNVRTATGSIAGYNLGRITNVYATSSVTTGDGLGTDAGGLVGANGSTGHITYAYATGTVTAGDGANIGGLVGENDHGSISDAYATGAVNFSNESSAGVWLGGLVGWNSGGSITHSYATGAAKTGTNGDSSYGGLVGYNLDYLNNVAGTVTASYWDTQTTGQAHSAGSADAAGLSTTALIAALPSTFDTTVWGNAGNQTTPYLLALSGNQVFSKHDLPSGTPSSSNRPNLYTAVLNVNQLQAMSSNLAGRYVLGNNIDASITSSWNGGAGFVPVGNDTSRFTGQFDGLGFTIDGLTINRSGTDWVGLFGASTGTLRNVGLTNAHVVGTDWVGTLAGSTDGTVSEVYATGTVQGAFAVGGLVGGNGVNLSTASVNNAYTAVTVTAAGGGVGGLAGYNYGTISNAYATGDVIGTGSDSVGGLVGYSHNGTVRQAYATGAVSGSSNVRGLVGDLDGTHDAVTDSFYATTNASGTRIDGSYDPAQGQGGTGKTLAELKLASTFAAWGGDLATSGGSSAVWRIYDGSTTPLLRSFLTAVTLSPDLSAVGKTYDGSIVSGTVTANTTGLDASQVLGTLGYATTSADAGTYSVSNGKLVVGTGLYSSQHGYDINYNNTSFTIDKAHLTVTADHQTRLYGQANPTLTQTITGFVHGENASVVSGSATVSTSASATTAAGTHAIGVNVSGLSAANYDFIAADGTLTIGKAQLMVTANSQTRLYGQANPALTQTITGFVNGENASVVSGSAQGTTTASASTGVGTYAITGNASGLSAANYDFAVAGGGTLTIDKAHLTVTADPQTRLYGQANPTLTQTITGFVNGEDAAVVSGSAQGTTTASALTGVGTYAIGGNASGLSAANYDFAVVGGGMLTIDKAHLTVTADNQTRLYGQANPMLTQTITGFVNGENASVVSGSAMATTSASAATGVGSYAIDVNASGLSAANYDFVVAGGTLTIDKASATVIANSSAVTYNGQLQSASGYTVTGLVNGEDASVLTGLTDDAATGRNAGSHVHAISGSDLNYALTFVSGSLDIGKAALTISTNAVSKSYDGGLSATGANAVAIDGTGLLGGDTLTGGRFEFVDKNAGTGKAVRVSDVTVNDGNGGNNYDVRYASNTGSVITPKEITAVGLVAHDKIYDGTTLATLSGGSLSGVVAGDSLTLSTASLSGRFTDPDVGDGKTVLVTGSYALSGAEAGNYALAASPAQLTASILPRAKDPETPSQPELPAILSIAQGLVATLRADRDAEWGNPTARESQVLLQARPADGAREEGRHRSGLIKGRGVRLSD